MIDITNAGDLRAAYLQTFESFSIEPGDIVDSSEGRINNRYARELLGVLTNAGLLTVEDVNGEGDVWQVQNPGTYDNHTREEAEAVIDHWLSTTNPTEKKDSKMTTNSTAEKPAPSVHPCYCGCGEQVPAKSFYRPGHDARHAGNIGRLVAADGNEEHYNDLPSVTLVAKAKGIAAKAREKADAKAKREQEREARKAEKEQAKSDPEAVIEEGSIKIGKNEYVANRHPDGKVTYFKNDEEKVASKTAAATFTA